MKICGQTFLIFLFSYGLAQDPPGIRWKQINTPHYQIIFPPELIAEANRVANLGEFTYAPVAKTLGGNHKKIPLVLNNRSALPNGFVKQGPWMSEWFNVPVPMKIMGSNEWYNILAVHETRHMVQYSFMDRSVNRFLGLLFGHSIQNLYLGMIVPAWYWEGDAVDIETALTQNGRGRIPYFTREIRSYLIDNIQFGYRKAMFGSFRDAYPDYYHLGFLLTTHVKRKYGSTAWPEILDHALGWPFTLNPLFPWSRAVKKTTGNSVGRLYGDAMDHLAQLWKNQLEGMKFTKAEILSPGEHLIRTDYDFPAMANDESVLAIRHGMGEVPTLVRMKNGKTRDIVQVPSIGLSLGININGGRAVWTEYHPDLRWSKLSWADIVVYDIASGKRKQLTDKARYYNPSLSKDGLKVAAVEFTEMRECFLVVLDANSGEQLGRYPSPNGGLILFPSWSEDGGEIAMTAHRFAGKGIYVLNVKIGQFETVKADDWEDILRPVFYQDYILYESPYSGIDNIYAIHRQTRAIFQVTSGRVGAYNPFITTNGELLYNDFSRLGNAVARMPLNQLEWIPLDEVEDRTDHYIEQVVEQEQGGDIFKNNTVPIKPHEVTDYKGFGTLMNFHSRFIFDNELNPSLGMISDNVLGTLSLSTNLAFDQNENTTFFNLGGQYRGWFPVLDVSIGFGGRSINHDSIQVKVDQIPMNVHITELWQERRLIVNVGLPLINRIPGFRRESMSIWGGLETVQRQDSRFRYRFAENMQDLDRTIDLSDLDETIYPGRLSLVYQREEETSLRDLMPKGMYIHLSGASILSGKNQKGDQVFFSGEWWLPGFRKHHGFMLVGEGERNRSEGYAFSSRIAFPRGYKPVYHELLVKGSFKYKLPLFYPDWEILRGVSYLKRISLGVFSEWAQGRSAAMTINYWNIGVAVTFESFFLDLNISIPITLAYVYKPQEGAGQVIATLDF